VPMPRLAAPTDSVPIGAADDACSANRPLAPTVVLATWLIRAVSLPG